MKDFGTFEIRVSGNKGNEPISPDNMDIREISALFDVAEDILFPNGSKTRPVISYSLEAGSARNIFRTSMQAAIMTTALLLKVSETGSLDFLELKPALAIERMQDDARRKNLTIELSTSEYSETLLSITPATDLRRSPEVWVDAELYFYGTLNDAGGKESSNIHLDTKEFGQIKIDATKDFLKNLELNPLYKEFGVRARGKQSIKTGEIDRNHLEVIEIHPFVPRYDEAYIKGLISKATKDWEGVDVDEYMSKLRNYE